MKKLGLIILSALSTASIKPMLPIESSESLKEEEMFNIGGIEYNNKQYKNAEANWLNAASGSSKSKYKFRAANNLANLYLTKEQSVAPDLDLACRYLTIAYEQEVDPFSHAAAGYNLSTIYLEAQTQAELEHGVKLLKEAHEQQVNPRARAAAKYKLGKLHINGHRGGVEHSPKLANMLLEEASSQSDHAWVQQEAKKLLSTLNSPRKNKGDLWVVLEHE